MFSKNVVLLLLLLLLLLRRSYNPASLHNCCSSTPEWRVPHTSNIKMQKILNNFPLQNGLRVLTFDRHHAMLVVSKPSPNNLFPGYGIVKVKLNISLQKYCHVSLKFVGLQYLHIKVCFVTYFTELCWCLVQLNLKTGFHMIVRIIPVVSKNVQTIGMIIWKHYPDDRKWPERLRRPWSLG